MMASTFAPDLFAGKCVLVAGGTSGIGAGIAAAFAQCGAMVTVTGATASEVATACAAPDTAPNAFVLDVRDAQAVTARALGHARGRRGRGTVSMLTGRTIHDRRSLAGGRRLSRELIAGTTPRRRRKGHRMTLSPLMQAVEHLERGDWTAAHALAQEQSGALGFWAHGIVHLIEGDIENARYWYERAHRALPDGSAAKAEITALRSAVESGTR